MPRSHRSVRPPAPRSTTSSCGASIPRRPTSSAYGRRGATAPRRRMTLAATGTLNGVGPTPTHEVTKVHVKGSVTKELLVQVGVPYINGGPDVVVTYNSTDTPSGFKIPIGAAPVVPAGHPTVGPYAPISAGESGLHLAAVPANTTPTAADVAAGTGMCASSSSAAAAGSGSGSGSVQTTMTTTAGAT